MLKNIRNTYVKKNLFLIFAIGLLGFGLFNLSNSIYAQNENTISVLPSGNAESVSFEEHLLILVVEQLLTIVGPITGSVVLMFTQFLNKKGIKISQETQNYFAKTASDYVQNEARYVFKQFMDKNSPYYDDLRTGHLPSELKNKIFTRTKDNLKRELKSDSFSRAAKKMLEKNLTTIIETAVSKNHHDKANRAKQLLVDLVPVAIDSALLYHETSNLNDEQKKKIVDVAVESLKTHFDQEYLIMSVENAKMHVEAELKNRIVSN